MARSSDKAQLPKLPDGRVDLVSVLDAGYDASARAKDGKLKTFLEYQDVILESLRKGYTRKVVLDAMRDAKLMTVSESAFSSYVRKYLGSALTGSVPVVVEDQMSDQERRLLGKGILQLEGRKPVEERRKPVDDSHVKYG